MEIRNINFNDLKDLFEWRNNYESRKHFFNKNKITQKEHQTWFEESMKNPNKEFFIGEESGIKLGVCRFDYYEKKNYSEVSININPAERGKGYGKELLNRSVKIYLGNKKRILRAKIKEDNIKRILTFPGTLNQFTKCVLAFKNSSDNYPRHATNQHNSKALHSGATVNGRINLHATMPSMSGHQQGALLDYIVDCYEEFNTVQKPSFRNMMNAFSSKSFVATKEGIKALVNKHNILYATKLKLFLQKYGITSNKVSANFLLLNFKKCKFKAKHFNKKLKNKGIILRSTEDGYKIKNMLRLTIGSKKDNFRFMSAVKSMFNK